MNGALPSLWLVLAIVSSALPVGAREYVFGHGVSAPDRGLILKAAAREAASVPQYAGLNEEDPVTKKYTRYVGSVVWRLQSLTQKPGQNAEVKVDATVEIPERHLGGTISFSRNTDKTFPASHIIDITFKLPPDFEYGGIANVPGMLMAAAPPARGVPLFGRSVEVLPGEFSVGLTEMYVERNLQLLREEPRIHIPIVYTNGLRAILVIDKGSSGQLALGRWATQKP